MNANLDASKKKKYEGTGGDGLAKLAGKHADHVVKKTIPHSTGSKIQALAWGPGESDQRMAVVDQIGTLFVWHTAQTRRMYGCVYPFAQCVALNADQANPMVLVGGMRNATVLYKKVQGEPQLKETKTWVAHDGYISSLKFMNDNKYISSGGDADIRIFDLNAAKTNESLCIFRGHSKDCQSIKFARDDKSMQKFITCSSDKTTKVFWLGFLMSSSSATDPRTVDSLGDSGGWPARPVF